MYVRQTLRFLIDQSAPCITPRRRRREPARCCVACLGRHWYHQPANLTSPLALRPPTCPVDAHCKYSNAVADKNKINSGTKEFGSQQAGGNWVWCVWYSRTGQSSAGVWSVVTVYRVWIKPWIQYYSVVIIRN